MVAMDDFKPAYLGIHWCPEFSFWPEEYGSGWGLANQSAVFQISTNQRAGYSPRDNFDRYEF